MNPVGQAVQPAGAPLVAVVVKRPAGQSWQLASALRVHATTTCVPALHVVQLLASPAVQNVTKAWHDASFVFSAAEAGVE